MCEFYNKMNTDLLIITQTVTGVLLAISEILGLSKCKSNGLIDFIYNNFICKQKRTIQKIDLCQDDDMPVIYQIQTTNPLVARRITVLAASFDAPSESRRGNAQQVPLSEWSE